MKKIKIAIASLMICSLLVGGIGYLVKDYSRDQGMIVATEAEGTPPQDPDPIKE